MRRTGSRKTPVILKGMAGFLLLSKIRNKSICILIGYVILALCVAISLPPLAYSSEVSSADFIVSIFQFLQGGGPSSSANNNAQETVMGDGIASFDWSSGTLDRAICGQLYLFAGALRLEERRVIADLTAMTNFLGSIIPPATWQTDNDPYFYWKITVQPPTLIGGFSVSLDTHPDLVIDTTEPDYQFEEESLTSGKHTFYVLPFSSGKVWEEESLLSFEIWVDTESPIVSNLEPAPGAVIYNNNIPISCTLYDAHSGIDIFATTLTLNNENVLFDYDSKKETLVYKPTTLPEGKNTVLLKAIDAVGNSVVKGWEFVVDTQPPLGEILINAGQEITYSAYVSINIEVKDAASGIKNIYLSNDGVFDTELNKPYPYSPVISGWLLNEPDVNGLKTVYAKFQDYAGNLSETYKDRITLELRTPNTRIISGPATTTEETEATFIYEGSRDGCLFSYRLDDLDWSEWQSANRAHFTGLAPGNHYFSVKSAFDLNGDGKITIDEEDATPAQWVWTIKSEAEIEKEEKKTLFWRR